MALNLKQVTATGNVDAQPRRLASVIFTPGTAASTLEVRDGSGGPIVMTFKGPANGQSIPWSSGDNYGVPFQTAIHATLTGTGAVANFEFN